ncbi:MAG: hypothetical protein ACYTHM_00265 [Planctomycetota bacterium]|jgi:hypothetical protein
MHNLFWNLQQEGMIRDTQITAKGTEARLEGTKQDLAALEARLDKLLLINQAMWSLLMKKTGLTEQDLTREVTDLDLQDGVLDGKARKPVVQCAKCEATVCHKFNRCLFCGEPYEGGSAFSTV